MAIKSTQSTSLRPEGVRILDAPLVEINLKQLMEIIQDEKTWAESGRNAMTVYKTDGMRIVLIALRQNEQMAEHKAEGIVSILVMQGILQVETDERTVELTEGKMVTMHKEMRHSVKALETCAFLLTIAD